MEDMYFIEATLKSIREVYDHYFIIVQEKGEEKKRILSFDKSPANQRKLKRMFGVDNRFDYEAHLKFGDYNTPIQLGYVEDLLCAIQYEGRTIFFVKTYQIISEGMV